MDEMMRFKEGRNVSLWALIVNVLLAIFKISIGYIFRSRAMVADGIHSTSDSFSTIIVIFSLKIASNPPDSCHPYGHERSETLAANLLGLSLILSGLIILKDNIFSIIHQNLFYPGVLNIWAGMISILAQEGTYRYSIYIGKKINSPAIIADAKHHRSDAISSIAAVIGIIAARNGFPVLDPITGIIVGGMIIHMGIEILLETIHEFMEHSPEPAYLDDLSQIAQSVSQVKDVTDVRVRKHAGTAIVEMTITVYPGLSVFEGDEIAHRVKDLIISKNKEIKDVVVHVDPDEVKSFQREVNHQ